MEIRKRKNIVFMARLADVTACVNERGGAAQLRQAGCWESRDLYTEAVRGV